MVGSQKGALAASWPGTALGRVPPSFLSSLTSLPASVPQPLHSLTLHSLIPFLIALPFFRSPPPSLLSSCLQSPHSLDTSRTHPPHPSLFICSQPAPYSTLHLGPPIQLLLYPNYNLLLELAGFGENKPRATSWEFLGMIISTAIQRKSSSKMTWTVKM